MRNDETTIDVLTLIDVIGKLLMADENIRQTPQEEVDSFLSLMKARLDSYVNMIYREEK